MKELSRVFNTLAFLGVTFSCHISAIALPINITNPLPDTSPDALGKPAAAVALHNNSPFAPGSFGDGDVFSWLNTEIDNWNTAHGTSYPDAVGGAGGAALLQST